MRAAFLLLLLPTDGLRVPRAAPRLPPGGTRWLAAGRAPHARRSNELRAQTSAGALGPTIGSALVGLSITKYVPQMTKILRSRSTQGLAPATYYSDTAVFTSKSLYHWRRGHPIDAWGELIVLWASNLVLIALLHEFRDPDEDSSTLVPCAYWSRVARDLLAQGALVGAIMLLPSSKLGLVGGITAPLLVNSFAAQIVRNWRRSSTGALSAATVFLRLLGSSIRAWTTVTQLGGDRVVLLNHGIGIVGAGILLGQVWWYALRKREKVWWLRRVSKRNAGRSNQTP